MPVLLFILLLIFTFAIAYFLLRPTKTETQVQQHLEDIKESRAEATGQTILREEGYSSNTELNEVVRQIPGALGTLNLIRQSGQNWKVSAVMAISLLSVVAVSGLASLLMPDFLLLDLIFGVAAGSVPYLVLFIMREQRFRKCDNLLPDAIDLMARGLRAGHALTAVIEMVSEEIGEPISSEFRRLHEEHQLGLTLREATLNLVNRLPRDDVRFLATAILMQKETGGNLAAILDKTGAVARERARLRGQLKIYTAQGRVTGWVLCLLPFIMFGLLSTVNWQFEKLLFTEDLGRTFVYVGLGLMVLGVLVIRKIIDIRV
jgi:tight adherence protein B